MRFGTELYETIPLVYKDIFIIWYHAVRRKTGLVPVLTTHVVLRGSQKPL